jgi:hypothetical protein
MASARMQLLSKDATVDGDLILHNGSVAVYNPSKTKKSCVYPCSIQTHVYVALATCVFNALRL